MSYLRDKLGVKITDRYLEKTVDGITKKVSQKWLLNATQADLDWFEVTIHPDPVKPAYDPSTQYLTIGDDGEYVVNDYTAEELAENQQNKDIATLQDKGKDVCLVLTELISWMLANTNIKATDFTPEVRQAYQDIKAIADRIKS